MFESNYSLQTFTIYAALNLIIESIRGFEIWVFCSTEALDCDLFSYDNVLFSRWITVFLGYVMEWHVPP
jgi:hypothetical protein